MRTINPLKSGTFMEVCGCLRKQSWRRRRDSNPRYRIYQYGGLANRWFQPLTHVSGCGSRSAAYSGGSPVHQGRIRLRIATRFTANRIRPAAHSLPLQAKWILLHANTTASTGLGDER
jgi:hypothetical protein